MASLRRSKTLSPDGQTARFLYTIIKQLDLKSIDWNLVAGSLEITNGHAARMRYSRFKQHMEGQTTQPRASKAGNKEKDGKEGQKGSKKGKKRCFGEEEDNKKRAASCLDSENGLKGAVVGVKTEGGGKRIKNEPDTGTACCAVQVKSEPDSSSEATFSAVKREPEPGPGPEPDVDDFTNPDIWRILPRSATGHRTVHDQTPRSMMTAPPAFSSTTQTISPSRAQLQQQPTVSLADLEVVSPLSRPSADVAIIPRSTFIDGTRSKRDMVVHIKAEPRPDADWMVLAGPSAGAVVKREPVEA